MDSRLTMAHTRNIALAFALFLVAQPAYSKTASEVFEIASKSTVVIKKLDAKGKTIGFGSGVVLPGGDIVTNCHVVEGAVKISVRSYGKDYPAILRYSDWERDVCSVSATGINQNAPITMGSTKKLKVGKPVYAIGSPQGLELTLSDGIVSSLREVVGGNYIQTTAAISPGSSGGGLFDENGALVGLTTFYLAEGQNLNFAVPVEWVTELPKRHEIKNPTVQPSTQWLNKAIELEASKDWTVLIEHCLRWTKSQPQLEVAWYSLGNAYGQSGQTTKASEAFLQAIRINPENSGGWYNLGTLYLTSGHTAKAIESFLAAIRINPVDAQLWNNLGNAYGRSGQTEKAIESLQKALKINPENASAWGTLGMVYDGSGQYAKAIESFIQALRIDPGNAAVWNGLGTAYGASGQFKKAIESYQQAILINPEFASAWGNLGIVYGKSGETEKAIEPLLQALRINPEDASVWFFIGMCYRKSGQSSKVTEVYKRLKVLNSATADEFFNKIVMP